MTRLVHFSPSPLGAIRSVDQLPEPHMKPKGLWVSVEGDGNGWLDWCKAEHFELERWTHAHEITLRDGALVLWLKGPYAIDDFTRKFKATPEYLKGQDFDHRGYYINWQAVAAEYPGIIIAPYCWPRRLYDGTGWYYGWDCASGCIWDASAIESVRLLENAQ